MNFVKLCMSWGWQTTKTPKESTLQSEEEVAAFLKTCSDADMSMDSTECMSNIEVQNQLYVSENLFPTTMIKIKKEI